MDADQLQALVIEMLEARPMTTSEHIARYIAAKTRGELITIAEVNTVLERFQDGGYVVLNRPQGWQRSRSLERVMNFQEGISRKRPSRSLRFAGLALFRGVRLRTPLLQSSPTLLWDPKIERGASEETGWAANVHNTL